jgi:glycosyltransferase involved in cell wall biosynthesis
MAKRIALISDHASPLAAAGGVDSGGQNIYVAQVATHLARLGYSVDVFTRRDSAELPEIVEWVPGVRVVHVAAGAPRYIAKEALLPSMGEFCEWICRFARRGDGYALSHANFFLSGLASVELKRRLGIPLVVTFHALGRVRRMHQKEADRFPPERDDIEDLVIDEADAIVAECPQDAQDLATLYCAPRRRVVVIPCGFDKGEFWPIARPFARRTLGLPGDERILLNIGRLVPRKGIDNAIRGLARLEKQHGYAARLLVVGGNSDLPDPSATPEIGRLRALAGAEGVGERVVFTGRRSREFLKLYYSAADAFVTTPWYEPFGITPLEAMACGTPVIGADVGGIRFSVANGETGWLVPPEDPDALAERAACLFRDPPLCAAMGRAAIQRVNAHFTWRKVTRSLASLYQQVLDGSSPRARSYHQLRLVEATA